MGQAEARETAFARALRRAIAERRWSHRTAGAALGVSHTQIGRYLTGADPGISTASRLAGVLGMSLDDLAGVAEGPPPPPPRAPEVIVDGVRYVPDPTVSPDAAATNGVSSDPAARAAAIQELAALASARAAGEAAQPQPPERPKPSRKRSS